MIEDNNIAPEDNQQNELKLDLPSTHSQDLEEVQARDRTDVEPYKAKLQSLLAECRKVVVGQDELLELLLICILADGHVLLEGVPGIAKTLSTKVMAKTLDTGFARIQFTPDLMPSDILGTSIFDMKESAFHYKKGPIFSNLVLIDEINRAPAKTQAALFEVMEEKQITFDGTRYEMSFPFVIMATQNPVEQEGTYQLPEGQLDRFLMKIVLDYPEYSDEVEILRMFKSNTGPLSIAHLQKIIDPAFIKECQQILEKIYVDDVMLEYITKMTVATRTHSKVYLGASPRASIAILRTAKVVALLAGRDFVLPDDIQYVAPHVMNHRLILSPDAEMESITPFMILSEIIKTLEVPR